MLRLTIVIRILAVAAYTILAAADVFPSIIDALFVIGGTILGFSIQNILFQIQLEKEKQEEKQEDAKLWGSSRTPNISWTASSGSIRD